MSSFCKFISGTIMVIPNILFYVIWIGNKRSFQLLSQFSRWNDIKCLTEWVSKGQIWLQKKVAAIFGLFFFFLLIGHIHPPLYTKKKSRLDFEHWYIFLFMSYTKAI
jgi:hypothetical protein